MKLQTQPVNNAISQPLSGIFTNDVAWLWRRPLAAEIALPPSWAEQQQPKSEVRLKLFTETLTAYCGWTFYWLLFKNSKNYSKKRLNQSISLGRSHYKWWNDCSKKSNIINPARNASCISTKPDYQCSWHTALTSQHTLSIILHYHNSTTSTLSISLHKPERLLYQYSTRPLLKAHWSMHLYLSNSLNNISICGF